MDGEWPAVVVRLIDAGTLDPGAFAARHVLAGHPGGRVAILRVSDAGGPVLSDVAFDARARSAS